MGIIEAPMTANVWKVLVAVGDDVEDGDTVAILEAMKMEIPVDAEESGVVIEVHVEEGGMVEEGEPVVTLG